MSKSHQTAIPLLSLNAVAFDCETNGLDTRKARMIQLGGVAIVNGEIQAQLNFQELINPQAKISAANSAIHDITDIDVADARPFHKVYQNFENWRGDSLLIGYTSGFDLAMLKRETSLAGLDWEAPRCIDIRYLVHIVNSRLPDYSLDTIAKWLGVEVVNRHSALGDSLATAEIFLALIAPLRELGIRTLAEAETACLPFLQLDQIENPKFWLHDRDPRKDHRVLERIDSFPYRHRLKELMSSPPIMVSADTSLSDALDQMVDKQVSSLYVTPSFEGADTGIITERDLLRAIRQGGHKALLQQVADVAQFPLLTVPAEAYVYRAIAKMQRLHIRHLGICDTAGKIIGALSGRDLIRQRADDAVLLGDAIDNAQSAGEMADVWGNISTLAQGLIEESVDARDIASVISRELCALTRQACKLAEREMPSPAPCSYAMLVLGSGGRGESLLAMDQDNAIVFEKGEPGGKEDLWFAQLASKVTAMLDASGIPYCKGDIMASNSQWRHSRPQWRKLISSWIERQNPDDIMNCDIFFDGICVHGDYKLADDIFQHAFRVGSRSKAFQTLMAINACKFNIPIGMFNRFKLHDGRMDIKIGGIMPLFSCARLLAIKHWSQDSSLTIHTTRSRFEAISQYYLPMRTIIDNLIQAHGIIFNSILRQQLMDIDEGIPLSNKVSAKELSSANRDQLKWALDQISNVSSLLGTPLGL